MDKHIKNILKYLDKSEYSSDLSIINTHSIDWRKNYNGNAELIVFPKTVQSLQKVINECNKYNISVIPQGGNTSLVGGAVPLRNSKRSQIIVNLKKLNKIINFDSKSLCIQIESGCILEDIQNYLKKKNFYFPLSIGSRGNCQIGGNIATNAGGVNVVKYGSLRSNILGLEAIMADGSFYSNINNVRKDNSGYDIKQLLIGSEGTLGLITAVNVRIYPKPLESRVIFGSFNDIQKLINFYSNIRINFHDLLTSFELINSEAMELVIKNKNKKRLIKKNKFYCLLEFSNYIKNIHVFSQIEEFFYKNLEDSDNFIFSKSYEENKKLWDYRELIPIAETNIGLCINHDISIPLNNIKNFIEKTEYEISTIDKSFKIINFGHIGDNNLHYNIYSIDKKKNDKLKKAQKKINKLVFENVFKYRGSFSAEHGVGQLRIDELKRYKSKFEILQMKNIKKSFDPHNILNPNKLFKI